MAGKRTQKTNAKQRKFVDLILSGVAQHAAYRQVYKPDSLRSNLWCASAACMILANKNVKEYKAQQEEEIRKKLVSSQVWEKENSVEELKFVIEQNKEEIIKIQESVKAQIEDIIAEMDKTEDVDKLAKLGRKLAQLQGKYVLGKQHNDGIVQAVSELNRMHGFNHENVALTYPKIIYSTTGEDLLD